jgi:hypothetical protein
MMTDCHDLKAGDVYTCPDCGLEIQITKACNSECKCPETDSPCVLTCCGKELVKK